MATEISKEKFAPGATNSPKEGFAMANVLYLLHILSATLPLA